MSKSEVKKCPKCGGEMEVKSGWWDHNLTVKAGMLGMQRPEMHVCKECGFIEFYLK
jgi:predicted nucleic-acid-binding Zn-ribbon protein